MLERHIHAYLVQRFFHETVPTDTGSSAYQLFESLGTVEQFLSDAHPCSLLRMEAWLTDNEQQLRTELGHWVPTFSYGLDEDYSGGVRRRSRTQSPACAARLRAVLPVDEYAQRDQLEGI